ncbi:MAG: hypothetical protein LH461_05885 [Spirochaetaceae bacterium]|nr:hypothetical protein [Spirochaetaceae bacterium]
MMTFSWRLESSDGSLVTRPDAGDDQFPSQADAESWVGETWQDLLADGVDQVSLLEGDRVVYGPMSLHPAE